MKSFKNDATNNERDTARIEAFSDGVFSIAITLLVLNILVPDVAKGGDLWNALGHQWTSYLGYVTSFIVIGIIWTNHHHMFTYINRTDYLLLILNTFGLMFVAFIPFPTSLIARYITTEHARIAVAIYSGTLLMVTLIYDVSWWYATKNFRLVRKDIDIRIYQAILRSYLLGISLYILSFGLAFINVEASLMVYILIAALYLVSPSRALSIKFSWPLIRSHKSRPVTDQQTDEKPGVLPDVEALDQ